MKMRQMLIGLIMGWFILFSNTTCNNNPAPLTIDRDTSKNESEMSIVFDSICQKDSNLKFLFECNEINNLLQVSKYHFNEITFKTIYPDLNDSINLNMFFTKIARTSCENSDDIKTYDKYIKLNFSSNISEKKLTYICFGYSTPSKIQIGPQDSITICFNYFLHEFTNLKKYNKKKCDITIDPDVIYVRIRKNSDEVTFPLCVATDSLVILNALTLLNFSSKTEPIE